MQVSNWKSRNLWNQKQQQQIIIGCEQIDAEPAASVFVCAECIYKQRVHQRCDVGKWRITRVHTPRMYYFVCVCFGLAFAFWSYFNRLVHNYELIFNCRWVANNNFLPSIYKYFDTNFRACTIFWQLSTPVCLWQSKEWKISLNVAWPKRTNTEHTHVWTSKSHIYTQYNDNNDDD